MITSGITEPGFVPSDTKVRGFVTCLCSRWRRRPCRVTICTVSDVNKSYEAIPVYTCVKSKLDLATTLIAIVVVPSRVLSPVATHELFPSRVLAILVTHWCNRGGRYHHVSPQWYLAAPSLVLSPVLSPTSQVVSSYLSPVASPSQVPSPVVSHQAGLCFQLHHRQHQQAACPNKLCHKLYHGSGYCQVCVVCCQQHFPGCCHQARCPHHVPVVLSSRGASPLVHC